MTRMYLQCNILRAAVAAGLLLAATAAVAQKRIGDFIESKSYNDGRRGTGRTLQYSPEGRDFV